MMLIKMRDSPLLIDSQIGLNLDPQKKEKERIRRVCVFSSSVRKMRDKAIHFWIQISTKPLATLPQETGLLYETSPPIVGRYTTVRKSPSPLLYILLCLPLLGHRQLRSGGRNDKFSRVSRASVTVYGTVSIFVARAAALIFLLSCGGVSAVCGCVLGVSGHYTDMSSVTLLSLCQNGTFRRADGIVGR